MTRSRSPNRSCFPSITSSLSGAAVLPGYRVVRQPGGLLHFVVAWRRHGPLVQVMDPATGRRWLRAQAFADELYVHTMPVPAAAWRKWAESELFTTGCARARTHARHQSRGHRRAVSTPARDRLAPFAALDATLRMIARCVASGGFSRGDARTHVRDDLEARPAAADPDRDCTGRLLDSEAGSAGRRRRAGARPGAVLVRVRGVRAGRTSRRAEKPRCPRDVAAACANRRRSPDATFSISSRADGILAPARSWSRCVCPPPASSWRRCCFGASSISAHTCRSGTTARGDGGHRGSVGLLLALELPIAADRARFWPTARDASAHRLSPTRFRGWRIGTSRAVPRPTWPSGRTPSHQIRELPEPRRAVRAGGVRALPDDARHRPAVSGARHLRSRRRSLALAIPAVAQPWLSERDLRQRTHTGALTRFLSRRVPRARSRARARRRARARARAGSAARRVGARGTVLLRNAVATASGAQLAVGFGFAAWLLFARARLGDEGGGALLLAYWALNIPCSVRRSRRSRGSTRPSATWRCDCSNRSARSKRTSPRAGAAGFGRRTLARRRRHRAARGHHSSRRTHDPRRRLDSHRSLAPMSQSSDRLAQANPRSSACCSDGTVPPRARC